MYYDRYCVLLHHMPTQVLNQPHAGMLLRAVGQHLRAVVSFAYTTARQCALSCGCLIKYSSTARKCALACGCLMPVGGWSNTCVNPWLSLVHKSMRDLQHSS